MKGKGLKPIIGCEFYVCHEKPEEKRNRELTHLGILAKNLTGWKKLVALTSCANKPEYHYYKPRLDLENIKRFADGNLIAFSGHMGSDLANAVFSDPSLAYNTSDPRSCLRTSYIEDACRKARELQDVFGKGNFFIEIQRVDIKNLPAALLLSEILRDVSKRTSIPCIATPDAHYSSNTDAVDQRVLLCTALDTTMPKIHSKMVAGDDIALGGFFRSNNYHIPSYEEMIGYGSTEEELDNTMMVADMCEAYDLTSKPKLPQFDCPDGMSSSDYLKKLCQEGFERKRSSIQEVANRLGYTEQTYRERLDKEMKVLDDAGLADYFLIVRDIVNYAMSDGQLVGAGRGSAAGALTLYLLGVTHIDPIEYDLMFERFYNAGRNTKDHVSMPDVDMDFEIRGRDKIITYIKNRFGNDKVSQMLTFTRMQGRSALKDVLRVWEACSNEEANEITSHIPGEAEIIDKLEEMREEDRRQGGDGEASIIDWALWNHSKELSQWASYDSQGKLQGPMARLFAQAIRLEGTKRSQSKHPSGIVISSDVLAESVPMIYDKSSGEMIAGMEMTDLELAGRVKFDILGVAVLDKIHGVLDLLKYGKFAS